MTTNNLATLYILNSKKQIKVYKVSSNGNTVLAEYGLLEGKMQQSETVLATEEEALKEAQKRWENRIRSGYVEDLKEARQVVTEERQHRKGSEPMMPNRVNSFNLVFPAYLQPKYEGVRCIAKIRKEGTILYDKNGKEIDNLPHIATYLSQMSHFIDLDIDGVIARPPIKEEEVQRILSIPLEQNKDYHKLNYYVFDLIEYSLTFEQRREMLLGLYYGQFVKQTPLSIAQSEEDLINFSQFIKKMQVEDFVIRDPQAYYSEGKTDSILKASKYSEEDFTVVALEEYADGERRYKVPICETDEGVEFKVPLINSLKGSLDYWEEDSIVGRRITVAFQGFNETGDLIMPLGKALRKAKD